MYDTRNEDVSGIILDFRVADAELVEGLEIRLLRV
jgi:hypothetical protein